MRFIKYGLIVLGLQLSLLAETLVRGPYLQQGSETQAIVCWRTDVESDSVVRYGLSPDLLDQSVVISDLSIDHKVKLTGLQSNTKYYYSIGSTSLVLAGEEQEYFFRTHPEKGSSGPVRVWIIGDSGTGNEAARAVRDAYYNFTGSTETNVWLMLGDNAYRNGTDSEYQSAVFDIYQDLFRNSFVWSAMGNHDSYTSNGAPYLSIFEFPTQAESGGTPSGTELYYSFDYANIHFVCLDSEISNRDENGAMATWLRNDLANTNQPWIVAFFHHPPYTKGSHDSDTEYKHIDMRSNIQPILEDYGVDLVFGGHSHAYERSYLIDGHYGDSSTFTEAMKIDGGDGRVDGAGAYQKGFGGHLGAVYTVAGSSGKVSSSGSLDHPAMVSNKRMLGSVVLDVNGQTIEAKFIDDQGNIQDYFTLNKSGNPGNQAPSIEVTSPAQGSYFSASASFTFAATASDADGEVSLVEFFFNGEKVGEASVEPFEMTLSGLSSGIHQLTAKATDNEGSVRTTQVVEVAIGEVTLETRISSGSDDVEEQQNGVMYPDSTDLELVYDGSTRGNQVVGLRFDELLIPKGAVIRSAYLQFTVDETNNTTGSKIIEMELSEDAPVFSSEDHNVSSRIKVPGSVGWDPAIWDLKAESGVKQRTPELKDLVQQVVNQDGWASGQAMVFMISGEGKRVAEAYEGSVTQAPLLHIEYDDGSVVDVNQKPDVELLEPYEGLNFFSPADISISVAASDVDGSISQVEYFVNDSKVGESAFEPYSITLSGLAAGNYNIHAVATDDEGASAMTVSRLVEVQLQTQYSQVFEVRISSDADDVEEEDDGVMYLNSSDLELVRDGARGNQKVGLRFQYVTLPSNIIVENAYLQFQTDETKNSEGEKYIYGELASDALSYTQDPWNLTDRNDTINFVTWNPLEWNLVGESGLNQRTPNLQTIVQEVVDQEDWRTDQSMAFVISGSGKRVAESYRGSSTGAPLLRVEYRDLSVKTIFESRVSSDLDDVEEHQNGSMYMNSSDIELVYDGSNRGNQAIGLRFQNVEVPKGSKIGNAYIQFMVDETKNSDGALMIEGHAIGDAPAFTTSANNVSDRVRTSASVSWEPPAWNVVGDAGEDQRTSDISSIIEEIVAGEDWTSGNDIVIIISGSGVRCAESYRGNASGAALLHIAY